MSRIAYVNGRYVPHRAAQVHVEDRGYQFADGVYEVCEVRGGALVDERRHMDRLERSLKELRIAMPMPRSALSVVLRETVARNRVRDGILYLQVTRGVARRDHAFPPPGTLPSIVVTAQELRSRQIGAGGRRRHRGHLRAGKPLAARRHQVGLAACRTCSPSRRRARRAPRRPGSSTRTATSPKVHRRNAWIVTREGAVVTRPADFGILRGITRTVVLDVIAEHGLRLEERPFTMDEAYAAREAFITSATQFVMPVVRIDGKPIGNGAPGLIASALRRDYHHHAEIA